MAAEPGARGVPHGRLRVRGVPARGAVSPRDARTNDERSTQDWVELRLPCGCALGLLILVDARGCASAPAPCLPARDVARCILREWHRETENAATTLPQDGTFPSR